MIFRSLTLENFGTYAGRQTIDLTPQDGRPIVLIGGANGAGKTTLLESMLLCLHGRKGQKNANSQAAYEQFLATRIHVPPSGEQAPPRNATVTLTLEHVEGGHSCEYVVRRHWRRTPAGKLKEELALFRDGEVQEDVTGTMTQEFLDGLVPPALADLFLFDGEKIQDLADDDSGGALRDAVRRLLGLDLLERLRADLWRYVAHDADGGAAAAAHQEVEALERAHGAVRDELETALADLADLQRDRERLSGSLERQQERFAEEGGSLALARAELQRKLTRARTHADQASGQLHELVAGLLPLAICPEIARRLEQRLQSDEQIEEDLVVRRRLADAADRLATTLRPAGRARQDVIDLLHAALLRSDAEELGSLHDVSPGTRARMLSDLRQIRDAVSPRAHEVSNVLRKAKRRVDPLQAALDQTPDDDAIAPMLLQIQEGGRVLGELDGTIADAREQIQALEHREHVAARDLRKAQERLSDADGRSTRAQLAGRTIEVLEAFEARLGKRQLREVELETARLFNRLSRKGALLADVRIELDGFGVELERWDQSRLRKAQLSAGERQLFAIAVLWALAKVSGRPLPVVIDTPLARLDRQHREALLREYLPEVSHQVIILSTDTEIDTEAARQLDVSTARRYRLEHDAGRCATTAVAGYFAAHDEEHADAR